jgi:hypothetical protein
MSKIFSPEPGDHWTKKVEKQSLMFGQEICTNFGNLLKGVTNFAPDIKQETMGEIWQICFSVFIAGVVNALSTYGDISPEFEKLVIEQVKYRFDYIRKNRVKLMEAGMAEAQAKREKENGPQG